MLSVALHCPDQHISYDGAVLDRAGVGGGITARTRLAEALTRRGHEVEVVCNTPREIVVKDVRYVPLTGSFRTDVDVLIASSSGGALDLTPVVEARPRSRATVAWIHGVARVSGLDALAPDATITCSNFIRDVLVEGWQLPAQHVAVIHHGVERSYYGGREVEAAARDPYRLVYTSHPAKGEDAARGVLRLLRQEDERWTLHLIGGRALWGQAPAPPRPEPGVVEHGIVGQRVLADHLFRAGASLQLQQIPEAYGIGLAEARAAGAIAVCSPVGAYAELVRHGHDGLVVPGDHEDPATHLLAATMLSEAVSNPSYAQRLRDSGQQAVRTWDVVAEVWEAHLTRLVAPETLTPLTSSGCTFCAGPVLSLADGFHCLTCGRYAATAAPEPVAS